MQFLRLTFQLLIIFFLCNSCLLLEKNHRASRLISKNKHQKAHSLLHKNLTKFPNSVASHFLLSRVWLDSAWLQLPDSAHFYILKTDSLYGSSSFKERKKLSKYLIDTSTIHTQHFHTDRVAFRYAEKENTVQAFAYYITNYPKSKWLSKAIDNRNKLAFATASATHTWQAYQQFYVAYPQAEQVQEAKENYEQLLFEEKTQTGTLEAYRNFLAGHPTTPYRNRLLKNIYLLSTLDDTEVNYRKFISEFENNPYTRQALLHLLYKIDNPALNWLNLPKPDSLKPILSAFGLRQLPLYSGSSWQFISEEGYPWPKRFQDVHPDYLCEAPKQLWAEVWDGNSSKIISFSGTIIYAGAYMQVEELSGGLLKILTPKGWGLWLLNGNRILPPAYENIAYLTPNSLLITTKENYGILAPNGQWLLPLQQYAIRKENNAVVLSKSDSLHALVSQNQLIEYTQNNIAFVPQFLYRQVKGLGDSYLKAQQLDGRWHILDKSLTSVSPYGLPTQPKTLAGGLYQYSVDEKTAVASLDKSLNFSVVADKIKVQASWLIAKDSSGYQAYSLTLNKRFVRHADSLYAFHPRVVVQHLKNTDSLFVFQDSTTYSRLLQPKSILKLLQSTVTTTDTATFLLSVTEGSTTSIYNNRLEKIASFKEAEVNWPHPNVLVVKQKNVTRLYSPGGTALLNTTFEAAGNLQNNQLALLKNGKFGAYNVKTKNLLPARYKAIPRYYNDTLYTTLLKSKWGLVTAEAKEILPFNYASIIRWNDTLALTQNTDQDFWQITNLKNRAVVLDSLENLSWYEPEEKGDYLKVAKRGLSGVISRQWGWVVPPQFDFIENKGSNNHPVFYAEKELENKRYAVSYYNYRGGLLHQQYYTEEEWLKLLCE